MRKLEKIQIVKNVGPVGCSWDKHSSGGFFFLPLSCTARGFGVRYRVNLFRSLGYYGILRFRHSVLHLRYVIEIYRHQDTDESAALHHTALFTYTGVGVLSLLITVVGSLYVDRLFPIEPAFSIRRLACFSCCGRLGRTWVSPSVVRGHAGRVAAMS